MKSLPEDVLNDIIAKAKQDQNNPMRHGLPEIDLEQNDPVIQELEEIDLTQPHVCDETCEHNQSQLPRKVMEVLAQRAKRQMNQMKHGTKKKKKR
jgi:hypothetical protein